MAPFLFFLRCYMSGRAVNTRYAPSSLSLDVVYDLAVQSGGPGPLPVWLLSPHIKANILYFLHPALKMSKINSSSKYSAMGLSV